MNRGHANQFRGRLEVWIIAIFMATIALFVFPVQAADQWSQYAKIGPTSGNSLGAFSNPSGVAVDSSGNVYVADYNNHRIQKLTAATGVWSEWKSSSGESGNGLGEFYSPVDVAVDSGGNVYVADTSNHRIQKLTVTGDTGVWSAWEKSGGGSGSGLGEFNNPKGVAVDSSGNVYVADTWNHRIQKLTIATGVWSEWKKSGGGAGSGLGEFNRPSSVAIDSSGNVYVGDTNNHRIQKLNGSTSVWSEWKKSGGGSGSGLGEFNNPLHIAVDSSGNVYVADTNNHRIQKLTVTGATSVWSEWKKSGGGSGSGLGDFNNPKGVAVDSSGNVYVADSGNERMQKLTVAAGLWSEWVYQGVIAGTDPGEFRYPSGVAVDSERNVYVADYDNNRIQKLTVTGATSVWSEWKKSGGGLGSGLGEFESPTDVAVDSSGNVYVADRYNHRIQKLTVATGVWSEWKKSGGGKGSGPGEFEYPGGVAVDRSGNVYVADTNNHRIQKLTVATGIWSEWKKSGGGKGSSLGEFNYPSGLEVDSSGNVYVADTSNNRVQKLTVATGVWSEWKKSGGGKGSSLGEFNEPFSVAVDSNGDLYVADSENNRIQKLMVSTGIWSEWKKSGGGYGSNLGEFEYPSGVAIDSRGNVYVADFSNNRIQILSESPPGTPTAVTAEVTNGQSQATVSFTSPVSNGNSPIIGYTVTSSPGGLIASGTGSPITVTGLTYGTAYTFTVVATNEVGSSAASTPSNSVIPTSPNAPVTVPGVPMGVTAVSVNGQSQATVSFTAPVSNGGSAIIGYTVTSSPGGLIASGTGSPLTVTGLTYGTAYTFTVVATNEVGSSAASTPSNSVIPTSPNAPATVPGVPMGVTAVAVNGQSQATVSFTAPASSGGSPITGYTVTSSPGGLTASGTGSPITVTGLTKGISYTFTVIATNSVGSSNPSEASNAVWLRASSNNNGSSSTPTQPTPPTTSESDTTGATVLVNGKLENAGTVKVTNVNSQTVTTIAIDQNKLEDKLAKEGQFAVVTISVDTGSDVVIGELNGQMVSKMELQQAVLEIKTDKASFHMPAQQINIQSILDQVGKSVALQDIKVQIEIAVPRTPVQWVPNESTEGTIAIVVPPLDFTVRALYKDSTIEVTEFKAYVERTIAIPDGVDPNKITTGVVIETDGMLRHVPTKIVLLDGKYYAKVNSLTNSIYSVVWHPLDFKDVELHWAKKSVNDMGSRMVINGIGHGSFNPDQDITRAEFAAILIRGLGLKLKAEASGFSDVDPKSWFASAIGTAFTYNLINGFEDGTFRPNDKITREQAMTIMARAMTITKIEAKPLQNTGQVLNSFTDSGTISNWAESGISDCLKFGLVSGRNNTELAPKAFIRRAEVAVIVQRLLQKSDLI